MLNNYAQRHNIILIPGLGDEIRMLNFLTKHFQKYHLDVAVHRIGWKDGSTDFRPKFDNLLHHIDELSKIGRVSLVGTSAGGSAALNAFARRKKIVYKAVNLSGILRPSKERGWRSFEARTTTSSQFAQSVKLFVSQEKSLTPADRKRVMTVYPIFGDELVAPDTVTLPGATNIRIPSIEHVLSIALALTFFSKPVITFLSE